MPPPKKKQVSGGRVGNDALFFCTRILPAAPSPKAFRLTSMIKDECSRNSVRPQLFLLIPHSK